MPFESLTIEKLRAATKGDLLSMIVNYLTPINKKQISEFIWTIKNIPFNEVRLETLVENHDVPEGQLLRVYETTDILGNKLGSQKIEWTYYPTGEVDTIKILEFDAQDQVISTKTIKHFIDGRQPIILT